MACMSKQYASAGTTLGSGYKAGISSHKSEDKSILREWKRHTDNTANAVEHNQLSPRRICEDMKVYALCDLRFLAVCNYMYTFALNLLASCGVRLECRENPPNEIEAGFKWPGLLESLWNVHARPPCGESRVKVRNIIPSADYVCVFLLLDLHGKSLLKKNYRETSFCECITHTVQLGNSIPEVHALFTLSRKTVMSYISALLKFVKEHIKRYTTYVHKPCEKLSWVR